MNGPNYVVIITKIYEKYSPDKLGAVEAVLERFQGRESSLLQELVRKYEISEVEQAELGIFMFQQGPPPGYDDQTPPPAYGESTGEDPEQGYVHEVFDATRADHLPVVQATAVMSYDQAGAHGAYPPLPASGGSFSRGLPAPSGGRMRDQQGRMMPTAPLGAGPPVVHLGAHPLAARGGSYSSQQGQYSTVAQPVQTQDAQGRPIDAQGRPIRGVYQEPGNMHAKTCARIVITTYVCACCCLFFLSILSAASGGSSDDDAASNSTTSALVRGFYES